MAAVDVKRGHPAQSTAPSKSHWPDEVKPISLEGMDYMGVGEDGTLYWDGKPIVVRRTVDLNWWQTLLAFITAMSAAIVVTVSIFEYLR